MEWPPTLDDLKDDMRANPNGNAEVWDDTTLQFNLDAAIAYVQRVRPYFNYTADPLDTRPAPSNDMMLGVLRLAARWKIRTRTPDGVVNMGDLGSGRVPSVDPDIERLLGIGRSRGAAFG